ncbi:DUF4397 domain-containing protein [Cytobacillus sp. FJAT-53684]|uniref:DUF4397 domain-containing protein n=1 Tax=Cytobacillus mangrovibacter TaxID=3299024 RepID=A0ABW6JVB6_9BACI
MSENKDQHHHFQKAGIYDLLANYYKYSDPNKHIAYYQKHLKYIHLAAHSMRTNSLPQPNGAMYPAKVRFIHASTDASNVDIYVNSIKVLKDLPYKEVSDYLTLPTGKYQVDIYPAGTMVSTILSRKIIIAQGKCYTFIATGVVKNLKWVVLEDEPHVPHGETKIRFIHLSSDTPAVDIAVKNRDIIFSNISFRKFTSYLGLFPMTVDLEARVAGSNNIALSIPQLKLEKNKIYSILIVGSVTDDPELEAILILG